MDLKTVMYHGRIQLLRTMVDALGQNRLAKGLTAFDDGESTWSECFFARAFEGEMNLRSRTAENQIKSKLGMKSIVPIRFTWQAFDSARSTGIDRKELQRLLREIMVTKDLESLNLELNPLVNVPSYDEGKECILTCAG